MAKKKRKGSELGGLAGAFVKAGVASGKDAQEARRKRAEEDRELGHRGIAEREKARAEEHARSLEREAEVAREAAQRAEAEGAGARLRDAVVAQAETARGPRRWFFVARDGRIPFVEVSDAVSRMLADGHAGVVESLGAFAEEHVVVSGRPTLALLAEEDPEIVRFWNGRGGRA